MSKRTKHRHPDRNTPVGTPLRCLDDDVGQRCVGRYVFKGDIVYVASMESGWCRYRLTNNADAPASGGWFPYHFELAEEDWDE